MKHRIESAILVGAALFAAAVPSTATAASSQFSETIDLPAGFTGEGVATAPGGVFFAGERVGGRVARGNIKEGTSGVFVATPLLTSATGLKADVPHGLLWVSGGATGHAAVYDLATGEPVQLLTLGGPGSFINDVVVTRDAAYFTNSLVPVIYRVPVSAAGAIGTPETIDLAGPAGDYVPGFNLNGIEATPDGSTLISVNSTQGALYTIDALTGESHEIALGGATVETGDGILLLGRELLVLQNGGMNFENNRIAVVRLNDDLSSGQVVDTVTSPLFETATTLARSGGVLLAVNAQFGGIRVDAPHEVVLLPVN
ncbi:MAG TPA: hypothetical protein VGK49_09435 [Ilumatobacteraceae bacterium]